MVDNISVLQETEEIKPFRITDYTVAKYIMHSCWYEVSEDNAPPYLPDIVNEYWIGLSIGDIIIGCYRLHRINEATWQGHAFVLKEYRKEHSRRTIDIMFGWMLDNLDFKKLIVIVPTKFANVMAFLENAGFIVEGINRQSFTKDGKLWDMVNYGLTRGEIERLL